MRYRTKGCEYIFILIALMILFFECKDQDDLYGQYVTPGGIVYPNKADKATAKSGIGKVYIQWPNTTSTVTRAGIWWNNYNDSVIINILPGTDTVFVSLDVDEGIYSFFIKTFDKNNNVSVPVEVIGRSIGDKYMSEFHNRSITGYQTKGLNSLIIEWDDADVSKGALYSEVVYTAMDNIEKIHQVPTDEKVTEINDCKPGMSFKYNTTFQPDPEDDLIVSTEYKNISNAYLLLNKSIGNVIDKSSTYPDPSCHEKGAYDDDREKSRWHSAASGYPHFITIDLGAEANIERLVIWPSFYDNKPDRRMPSLIRWETSVDKVTWTSLGKYDYTYDETETNWNPREYIVEPVRARYIKLWGLDDPSGKNIMCLGEIDVYSTIGGATDALTPQVP